MNEDLVKSLLSREDMSRELSLCLSEVSPHLLRQNRKKYSAFRFTVALQLPAVLATLGNIGLPEESVCHCLSKVKESGQKTLA